MKIVILDDARTRRTQIIEGLGKHHDVSVCTTSNDFLTSAVNDKIELLMIDLETWNKGRSIYNYLNFSKKLEKTPALFYNADEGFSTLPERSKNEKDQILHKPSEVQTIIDTVQQM